MAKMLEYYADLKNDAQLKVSHNGLEFSKKIHKYKLANLLLPEEKDTPIGHVLAVLLTDMVLTLTHPSYLLYDVVDINNEPCFMPYVQLKFNFKQNCFTSLQRSITEKDLDSGLIQIDRNISCITTITSISKKTLTQSRKLQIEGDDVPILISNDLYVLVNKRTRLPVEHSFHTKSVVKMINTTSKKTDINTNFPYTKEKSLTVGQENLDLTGHASAYFLLSLVAHALCGENKYDIRELLIQFKAEVLEGDLIDLYVWGKGIKRSSILCRGNQQMVLAEGLFYTQIPEVSKI